MIIDDVDTVDDVDTLDTFDTVKDVDTVCLGKKEKKIKQLFSAQAAPTHPQPP